MLHYSAKDMRSQLRLTVSALAIAAAGFGFSVGADAETITLSSSNSPVTIDSGAGDTVVVKSGSAAYLTASYNSIPSGYQGLVWNSSANFSGTSTCSYSGSGCETASDVIQVEKGATLYLDNPWWWQVYESMFDVSGDIIIAHGSTNIVGSNTFDGNITLEDNASVNFGVSWAYATNLLGTSTNIIMGSGTSIYFYEPHTVTNTISTISSSDSTAALYFYNGTMVVDGINTTSSAYYGSVAINAGATFMVGDSSHSTAVFGDPTGSATKITISQSGGSMGVLSGFGTIYGSVTNDGIVRPGTTGTAGTLTIHGNYTQSSTGELSVQVTPTGASKLVVSGAATLDGTLVVNVASGTYSNAVYQIVSAGSASGSFSSVSYVGSDTSAIIGLEQTTTGYSLVTEKASAAQSFGHAVSSNRSLVASFTRTLYDQIEANLPAAGGTAAAADGEIRVWAAPFGRIDDVGKDDAGYDVQYGGLVGGGEYHFPAMNAVVGGAFSYAHGSMKVKTEDSHSSSNSFNLAVYGGADLELGRVDAVVFYNLYDVSMKRNMGDYGTAKSSPSGWSYGGSFQISQNIFDNLLSPYIRSTYSRNHIDGVTENGADEFALNYAAINQNAFVGDIGFKIHAMTPTPELKAKLEFTVGVAHDFSTTKETVVGQFANIDGSSFTYSWRGNNANSLLVGAEFADEVVAGIEVYGRLNGQFTANERAVELSVGGRYRF